MVKPQCLNLQAIKSNNLKRLAILGASGHGKVIAEIAFSTDWDSVDFYDDAFPVKASLDN